MIEMWEILVPTVLPNGKPVRTRYHRVWDSKVYQITNGLTVLTPTKGKWVCPEGNLFEERMIPVRIACTREQIETIIDMTIDYYNQKAVIAYRVSDQVIIKHREEV